MLKQGRGRELNKLILSDTTLEEVKKFRDKFEKYMPGKLDFCSYTLQKTLDAYYETALEWGKNHDRHSNTRGALFEDGVLSCVLLHVPESLAKIFLQGLYHQNDRPCKTDLILIDYLHDRKFDFYDFLRSESWGFNIMGACIDLTSGGYREWGGFSPTPDANLSYKKLVQKQQDCKDDETGLDNTGKKSASPF